MLLDSCKIAEICPLDSLTRSTCGLGDVVAVHSRHILHQTEEFDLAEQLLVESDGLGVEYGTLESRLVFFLFLDETVDTVEGNSAVVTYDPSSAVSIGKTRDDVALTCCSHLVRVRTENAVVVSGTELELSLYLVSELVAVSLTRLSCHSDTAEGIYTALERAVCLKSDDKLL